MMTRPPETHQATGSEPLDFHHSLLQLQNDNEILSKDHLSKSPNGSFYLSTRYALLSQSCPDCRHIAAVLSPSKPNRCNPRPISTSSSMDSAPCHLAEARHRGTSPSNQDSSSLDFFYSPTKHVSGLPPHDHSIASTKVPPLCNVPSLIIDSRSSSTSRLENNATNDNPSNIHIDSYKEDCSLGIVASCAESLKCIPSNEQGQIHSYDNVKDEDNRTSNIENSVIRSSEENSSSCLNPSIYCVHGNTSSNNSYTTNVHNKPTSSLGDIPKNYIPHEIPHEKTIPHLTEHLLVPPLNTIGLSPEPGDRWESKSCYSSSSPLSPSPPVSVRRVPKLVYSHSKDQLTASRYCDILLTFYLHIL